MDEIEVVLGPSGLIKKVVNGGNPTSKPKRWGETKSFKGEEEI